MEQKLHRVEKFGAKCVKGPSEIIRHMRYAFSKGYPTLTKVDAHDGEAVLVGAGPSVADNLEKIRELRDQGHMICAIKSAHDYLISHGIIPHMALAVDPQEKIAEIYRHPHKDVRYFMSTQCHPKVFDALDGYRVITWNVFTKAVDEYWKKRLSKMGGRKLHFVNGGSTSGLRCISLAWIMGYRKQHLFGFDSCLNAPDGATIDTAGNCDLKLGGVKSPKEVVMIQADGKEFYCDPAMALQANEFIPQLSLMGDVKIKAYGRGLIQWIVERAALRDMPQCRFVDEDWDIPSPLRGSLARLETQAA